MFLLASSSSVVFLRSLLSIKKISSLHLHSLWLVFLIITAYILGPHVSGTSYCSRRFPLSSLNSAYIDLPVDSRMFPFFIRISTFSFVLELLTLTVFLVISCNTVSAACHAHHVCYSHADTRISERPSFQRLQPYRLFDSLAPAWLGGNTLLYHRPVRIKRPKTPNRLRKWVKLHAETSSISRLQDIDCYYREFTGLRQLPAYSVTLGTSSTSMTATATPTQISMLILTLILILGFLITTISYYWSNVPIHSRRR